MQVGIKTHVGLIRENNEDAFFAEAPLFAVADGVGGANAGEIASKEAIDVFKKAFFSKLRLDEEPERALRFAAEEANRHLFRMAGEQRHLAGMSTTLTAVYTDKTQAWLLQVGDSRLYRWRQGVLTQLSEDQTLVAKLVATGKITKAEAKVHPRKSWLLQALGAEGEVEPKLQSLTLEPGDKLLLCTDGLSNMLSDGEISELLQDRDAQHCADSLIERALQNGGRDNVTAVVLTAVCEGI